MVFIYLFIIYLFIYLLHFVAVTMPAQVPLDHKYACRKAA